MKALQANLKDSPELWFSPYAKKSGKNNLKIQVKICVELQFFSKY